MPKRTEPIQRLQLPADVLVFPRRCVDCDGAPDTEAPLPLQLGLRHIALAAPFCGACKRLRLRRRLTWHAAILSVVLALFVSLAVLQEKGFAKEHSEVMIVLLLILGGLFLWWRLWEARVYHRRYSRIWLEGYESTAPSHATLASREPALLHAIAEQSGVSWTKDG